MELRQDQDELQPIKNINIYAPINALIIDEYEKKYAINKSLALDSECIITKCIIDKNQYYYFCNTCKVCISYIPFKKWFDTKNNCPHCRITFGYMPRLYRNKKPGYNVNWHNILIITALITTTAQIIYKINKIL